MARRLGRGARHAVGARGKQARPAGMRQQPQLRGCFQAQRRHVASLTETRKSSSGAERRRVVEHAAADVGDPVQPVARSGQPFTEVLQVRAPVDAAARPCLGPDPDILGSDGTIPEFDRLLVDAVLASIAKVDDRGPNEPTARAPDSGHQPADQVGLEEEAVVDDEQIGSGHRLEQGLAASSQRGRRGKVGEPYSMAAGLEDRGDAG